MPAPPVASLPMYDHPALRAGTDAFWRAVAMRLAGRGVPAPMRLARREDYETLWRAPSLLMSQTCGYPYATRLRSDVRLVATPCYTAPGCEGAFYRSMIVVRADDPAESLADCAGHVAAVNAAHSQSGHNALRVAAARAGVRLQRAIETGGHRASMLAVAEGRAGIAAIDCVTFEILRRHEPELAAGVRVIAESPPAPGLPYITASATDDATLEALRGALADAVSDPALAATREALCLTGIEVLEDAAYDTVIALRSEAEAAGQPPLLEP